MTITNDIMDHEVLGPAIRKGWQEGFRQGREEGRRLGRQEAIRIVLASRFGEIPEALDAKLSEVKGTNLQEVFFRSLNTASLEEFFQP